MTDRTNRPRDRYHAQVRAEILTAAWEQLLGTPAADLSVKAIAAQLQLTAPALYRYIGSRDELLGELAVQVGEELADVVEQAAAAAGGSPAPLVAVAVAVRRWVVAHPHHYLLRSIERPVPAAAAGAEQRALAAIGRVCEAAGDGPRRPRPGTGGRDAAVPSTTPAAQRAVCFWTRVHGVLGLELTGHLAGLGIDAETHLVREVATPDGAAV
ncbi:transcriptional regulator, TetR family [Jatrophihabitans endophyticus]|uniref:Transcriptional regulator, TetR family n=1 Tax=Jatrophihabitans endophyticus TaxID=1206085 RepID=A0A1M5U544_9ACTN|nr:TetR/AcrR family transcriptional regulator [Jatrophihabitans endophyticus]SHH58137.1 transcriptional regulator, TetR family [Jatrophihabitans endophyticus]